MDSRITTGYATPAGALLEEIGDHTQIRVADVTGDGKANLLVFKNGNIKVYGLNWSNTLVLLWQTNDSHISVERPLLLGDYNGDGKTDVIIPKDYGQYYAHYSATGNSFAKANAYYSLEYKQSRDIPGGLLNSSDYFAQQLLPIDMNHDGKTDLVALESKKYGGGATEYTLRIYEKHNAFTLGATKTVTGGEKYPLSLVLTADTPNPHLELGILTDNTIYHFESHNDMRREQLLRTITNGYGVAQHIHYTALTDTELYQDAMPVYQTALYTETYPNTDMGIVPGFRVVSRIEKAGVQQRFGYYGGVANAEGLGFLGFRAVARTNWHNQDIPAITTLTRHDPALRGAITESYTFTGLPWSLQHTPQDGISKTEYFYKANLAPAKVFTLKNTAVETLNTLKGTLSTITHTFDDYLNPTQTTTKLSHNGAVHQSTTTEVTYQNNPEGDTYYIGRLMEKNQSVTAYGDTMTSSETYQYNGQHLPSQIEKTGHQTEVLNETLTYDPLGNVTSSTLSADGVAPRTTSYQYDTSGRFLIRQTDVEGLQTQYSYDPATGGLLSQTDPYGRETTYTYDVWGKQTGTTDYLGNTSSTAYTKAGNTWSVRQTGLTAVSQPPNMMCTAGPSPREQKPLAGSPTKVPGMMLPEGSSRKVNPTLMPLLSGIPSSMIPMAV